MKRRLLTLALVVTLLAGLSPSRALAAEEGFTPVREYGQQFTDVSETDWYYENVKALYELGLTNGRGDRFAPEEDMRLAEALTMAARLRSLLDFGDGEAGPSAFSGEEWYRPYVSYLQSLEAVGGEFEGGYDRPATRGEMAHILANTLPDGQLEPMNREVVAEAWASGQYITDVLEATPYREDILLLYDWGVVGGVDAAGSFLPEEPVSRCQVAAMVARMAYAGQRLAISWEIRPFYSAGGTTMAQLVHSDGTFYDSPAPGEADKIDADVRYMLSRGERKITLNYPAGTLTGETVNQLMNAFLNSVRNYVEQTYNNVEISFSLKTGFVSITFSSSLYREDQVEFYREATMACAIHLHDLLWEQGVITPDMSQREKARAYFTWICENCRYDHANAPMSHSGYRVFSEGVAVCDGYTAAYNLLLKLEGISCGAYSTDNHIWTVAELDGERCHIDVTWGDQGRDAAYQYFGMTEEEAVARFG